MWWDGIEIIPPRPKLGLLGVFDDSDEIESEVDDHHIDMLSSDEDVSSTSSNSSSSDSIGSEECTIGKVHALAR